MAVESSTDASLVSRCKRRKENPEYPIQSPCRKRRIKHPNEPEPEPFYEFINKLPDAILFEILYRLPYRSAFKFMSVSKRWFSLISHPYFVSRFIHHRHQLDIQVLPPKNIYEFRIKSSFNDLLLVYREVPRTTRKPGFCKYYICNPFTKQWLKLLRIPLLRENTSVRVGFICDPYSCDKEHGCFTNVHYRNKVVRIHSPTQSNTSQLYMEIFSSETGEWCHSIFSSPRGLNPFTSKVVHSDVVTCNGMLHWADTEVDGMIKGFVVFDPFNDAEQCHYINLPIPHLPLDEFLFGVCQERLRIFQRPWHLFYPGSLKYLIWELEDYRNEGTWCRKHRVYLNYFKNSKLVKIAKNFSYSKLDFLAFHPKDGEILFFKFQDHIVECNSRTRVLEVAHKLKFTDVSLFLLSRPLWPTPVPSLPFELKCPPNC
ncbi:hypothetical protein ACB092_09G078400 [Castanea dentata]